MIGQAGGSGGQEVNWWNEEGRLSLVMLVPLPFLHPLVDRALRITDFTVERVQVLVISAPPAVGPIHNIDNPRLVSLVGVIVYADEIAPLVEGNLLRVTQASMDDLKIGSVGVEAENCSLVRVGKFPAFCGCHVHGSIANRAVKPAVGAESETVQVMPGKGNSKSETGEKLRSRVRDAVIVCIPQGPDMGNTGEVDLPCEGVDARGGAIEQVVESIGIDAALVGFSIAIGISENPDDLGNLLHLGDGVLLVPLFMHPAPVFGAEGGDIVGKPVAVVPVIRDAEPETVGFSDEDPAGFVDTQRRGRVELVLLMSRENLEPGPFGDRDPGQGVSAHESGRKRFALAGGLRKSGLRIFREENVVCENETVFPGRGIDKAQAHLRPFQVPKVPGARAKNGVALPGGLPYDLIPYEELDRGKSFLASASHEEAEVRVLHCEGRGGE